MNGSGWPGLPANRGVDEVGRGPLAGPVVAAAAVFSVEAIEAGLPEALCDVNDSKKLSAKKRAKLFDALVEFDDVEFGLSVVEPAEIDRINILQATHKAMHEALAALAKRRIICWSMATGSALAQRKPRSSRATHSATRWSGQYFCQGHAGSHDGGV